MVLTDIPKALNTSTVTNSEIGIAVSEIAVVRRFTRNMNRMIATTIPASNSTRSTLASDVLMKFACRNST